MQPGPEFEEMLDDLGGMPPPELEASIPDAQEAGGEPASTPSLPGVSHEEYIALKQEVEGMRKRLTDTHSWGQQANIGREFAEHLLAAQQQWQAQQRAAYEQAQSYQPPQLSEEQQEALVADPQMLQQYVHATNQATRNQVLAEIAPRLANAEAMAAVSAPLIEIASEQVSWRACAQAVQSGIDQEEFVSLLPTAYQVLEQAAGGNAVRYAQFRLNPQALLHAVIMAKSSRPASAKPAPRAPSVGVNQQVPGRRPAGNQGKSLASLQVSNALGVDFTPEELAEARSRASARQALRR